jgi:hypothetical protein
MGYQKPSKLTKEKTSKFLSFIYADLDNVLNRFDKVHPFVRKTLRRDLGAVIVKRVKESFKNGIDYGYRKAQSKYQDGREQGS